jgi:hypothetical protein
MKGPRQAAIIALLSTLVPMMFWLGAAIVGLVTLRQGFSKGLAVFIWAVVPALAWWLGLQDPTALIVLVLTLFMAEFLRSSVSLRNTLLLGFALSVLVGVLTPSLMPEVIDMLMELTDQMFRQLAEDAEIAFDDSLKESFRVLMVASFAASFYFMSIGSMFLARSWQAALYNPGGWREEFHQLRLSPVSLAGLFAVVFLAPSLGVEASLVAICATVPVVVCGLALVHGLIGKKNLGGQWVFGFYALNIVLFPTVLMLVALWAVVDSVIDFRSKIQSQAAP